MKTMITMVTERGQISIPAAIRRSLGVSPEERLIRDDSGEQECRVRRLKASPIKGAMAMRGLDFHCSPKASGKHATTASAAIATPPLSAVRRPPVFLFTLHFPEEMWYDKAK
jgi:AbrB family looped-hinge helix DNA binding protein